MGACGQTHAGRQARTDDEARERLRAEGPSLVEHELFEVGDEVVEVLDVPLEPAREPVAPVVLPEDWSVWWVALGEGEGEVEGGRSVSQGSDSLQRIGAVDLCRLHACTHPRNPPW